MKTVFLVFLESEERGSLLKLWGRAGADPPLACGLEPLVAPLCPGGPFPAWGLIDQRAGLPGRVGVPRSVLDSVQQQPEPWETTGPGRDGFHVRFLRRQGVL